MEVRSGYTQTELGVFPQEWEVKPLKQISPRQSVGLVINPSTYFDKAGTVPMLVGSNVSENRIDATNASLITAASNQMLPASRLATGDLVTVRVGDPGVTAVVPPELDGCNCASMMIVRRHSSFDSYWLCAAMNSRLGRTQVEHVQYGTAQKQFNISDAVDFQFVVPSLSEQRAIAAALRDVDALLDGLDRLIAKKRDLKQAAIQQLLTGQTRLPGFHGEWGVKRFGSLVERTFPKSTLSSGDGLKSGSFPLFVSGGEPKRTEIAQFRDAEALVFSDGGVFGVKRAAGSFSVTDHCFVLTLHDERADMRWFEAWFSLHAQHMDRLTFKGSGLRNLDKPSLRDIEIRSPDREEQAAVTAVLSDMDAEIAALEQRRGKIRDLKQAMMQELLTGMTRLVPAAAAHV